MAPPPWVGLALILLGVVGWLIGPPLGKFYLSLSLIKPKTPADARYYGKVYQFAGLVLVAVGVWVLARWLFEWLSTRL